jgi:hypothetical protein
MKNADDVVMDSLNRAGEMKEELNQIRLARALNRRNFMRNLGLAGAAVAGASVLSACGSSGSTVMAAGPSEADVLNFALNLEYLEAEFYLFATNGTGLVAADQGAAPGATTGGAKVTFSDLELMHIAVEIAADEKAHVQFLRSALGSAAVSKPAIKLDALGAATNDATFLTLARAFEDVGVSAYGGAATLLTGANLQAAAQILATEALHTGNLRLKFVQAKLTGTALDPIDLVPSDPSGYFNVDSHALAKTRTPSQVLAIVYGKTAAGSNNGGFFPNGVNGAINTV